MKISELSVDYVSFDDDDKEISAIAISYKDKNNQEQRRWLEKPRRIEHWEKPEKQFPFWDWKCSACGCEEYRQRDSHGNYRRMNFCPNCGAKMDEEAENK